MQKFQDFADQVGYDRGLVAPNPVYVFFAYKGGVAKQFADHSSALAYSKLVEKVESPEAKEVRAAHFAAQRRLENMANELWAQALREEYRRIPDVVYGVLYYQAYEDGHAYGFDEVANCMIGVVGLYDKIKKAEKEM